MRCCAVSGTDIHSAYDATRLRATAEGKARHWPTHLLCDVRYCHEILYDAPTRLHAMCSTDVAYVAMSLRACYEMSSTDVAYGATRNATGPNRPGHT
eukprot:1950663-Rhodomonas_salina.2